MDKCKWTQPSLTIKRTSKSVVIKRIIHINKVAILGDRHVIRKEAEKILKYDDLTLEIEGMWTVKTKVITRNNRGSRNDLKIFQTTPERNTKNARNQGTTENNHIGHCTHTAESAEVKGHRPVVYLSIKCLFPDKHLKVKTTEHCI